MEQKGPILAQVWSGVRLTTFSRMMVCVFQHPPPEPLANIAVAIATLYEKACFSFSFPFALRPV